MRRLKWSSWLVACLLLVGALFAVLRQQELVYATPETESAFFRRYSPEGIAKPFFSEKYAFALGHGESAGAGERSANHGADFDYQFVIQTWKCMPLMTALAVNMLEQLRVSRAELVGFSGDPRSGFRYEYISGNSVGNVTISPLEVPDQGQHGPKYTPGDEQPARLQITIREEWFKEKPGLMSVSAWSNMH